MAECSDSLVSNNINISKQTINIVQSSDPKENKLQNVMEPIFVDDFQNETYPKSVQNILSFLEESATQTTRNNDVLMGLIYVLMLETGFRPKEFRDNTPTSNFNLQKHLEFTKKLPSGWKSDFGTYKFSFILDNFEENECVVICCPSLDDLVINCTVKGIENGFTMYLDTLTYFLSSNINIHSVRLQKLRELSFKVKEKICNPAKYEILRQNFRLQQCFDVLPDEMIVTIMDYLGTKDFVRFGWTCKRCYKIMRSPLLWLRKYVRDFGTEYDPPVHTMTYEQINTLYKKEAKTRSSRYSGSRLCKGPYGEYRLWICGVKP